MTRLTKMTEESSLKLQVREYLSLMNIFSFQIQQSMGSYPGLPDRVIHLNGRVVYCELKKPKGKMSEAQLAFQEQCAVDGIPYYVIKDIGELVNLIEREVKK